MTRGLFGLMLAGILVIIAAPAMRAEDPPDKAKLSNLQMYEDIEIMRRLLTDKLLTQYAPLRFPNQPAFPYEGPEVTDSFRPMGPAMPGPERLPTFEGVYLKGQGVVFTITVPPGEGDPTALNTGTDKKSTSDWDRARKQLNREKPAEPEKAPPHQSQSLAEILLHALAENGSHFTQLGDSESLTVVVTFRQPDARAYPGPMFGNLGGPVTLDPRAMMPYGRGQGEWKTPTAEVPTKGDGKRKLIDDLISLGDLHHKQGQLDDAIAAYRKAMESADDRIQAVLLLKIAAILKEQNKDKEALDTIHKAEELMKERETKSTDSSSTPTATIPLPAKLIVSAPKKLLDQAGAGKMSFEEFAKDAKIELVSFPAQKK